VKNKMKKNKKILIVDDSLPTRKFIGKILLEEGYDVAYAENGIEALEKIYTSKFDMVITDINMPGMDGLEFLYKLRNESEFNKIPVILLSTEDSKQSFEEGIKIGADLYLVKPTSPDKIKYCIKFLSDAKD